MLTDHDFIRWHIYNSWGGTWSEDSEDKPSPPHLNDDYPVLQKTEWDSKFEQLMRNRLIMGSFRYGRLANNHKHNYDFISYATKKLELYKETGNLECLVDIANLMLLEFHVSEKTGRGHWSPEDNKMTCEQKTVNNMET